jgi:hypothetical protein
MSSKLVIHEQNTILISSIYSFADVLHYILFSFPVFYGESSLKAYMFIVSNVKL